MTGPEVRDPSDNISELLGKPGTLPVWLNPERFLVEDFNDETCVTDLRRYVPLATLQTELQSYLGVLKNKLVEVINEDYSDYVGLSGKLSNMDGAIMRMRKPLMELKDKLNVIQEAVKSELAALNQGLKRRKEVATSRSLLELLQELAHLASKVEKLLLEVKAAEGSAALVTHSRLLERVAGEVSRLRFQANRGQDLAFVKLMEPRIMSCRNELEQHLSHALEAALQERAHAAALHCLRAYVELGDAAPAEAKLRKVVVAPLVARILAEHKQAHPRTGSRDDSLWQLLESILTAVRSEAGPLLSASLSPQSGLRIFDFLGNVVLSEVQEALGASMPGIFSPGVPPAFHSNYLASMRFLDQLELMCQGRSALDKFRASHAYSAFLKRWNLSVYFSLLYQEIAGELEEASSMDKLKLLETPHPQGLRLPLSACLLLCINKCTNPNLFLPQLADKFVKLSLQLLQHYLHWMASALAARQLSTTQSAAASLPPHASPSLPAQAPLVSRPAGSDVHDSPNMGSEVEGRSGASWMAVLPTEDLSILHSDLEIVGSFVTSTFLPAMLSRLSSMPPEVVSSVSGAFGGMRAGFEAQSQALLQVMASDIVEKCVQVVKQLKGITATYRMTTKGPPTRHSHYVTGVMAPLRSFLELDRLRTFSPNARAQLTFTVADSVAFRYMQLAEELLTTVRKTESSLKRLKKARPGEDASGADAGMSDSDKISMQLYLDVQEFGVQLAKGFPSLPPLSGIPAYQKLAESVAPSNAPLTPQPSMAAPSPPHSQPPLASSSLHRTPATPALSHTLAGTSVVHDATSAASTPDRGADPRTPAGGTYQGGTAADDVAADMAVDEATGQANAVASSQHGGHAESGEELL